MTVAEMAVGAVTIVAAGLLTWAVVGSGSRGRMHGLAIGLLLGALTGAALGLPFAQPEAGLMLGSAIGVLIAAARTVRKTRRV